LTGKLELSYTACRTRLSELNKMDLEPGKGLVGSYTTAIAIPPCVVAEQDGLYWIRNVSNSYFSNPLDIDDNHGKVLPSPGLRLYLSILFVRCCPA